MGDREDLYVQRVGILTVFLFLLLSGARAQDQNAFFTDSAGIKDCIDYAMKHQPLVTQLKINERIADQSVKSALSEWFPQITSNAGFTHYLKQPVVIFPNFSDPSGPKIEVTTGVKNNSTIQFSASQKIFSSDLWLAARTSRDYRQQANESGMKEAIQLVVDVSKAYYDVLLTREMLNIVDEDIDRLSQSLDDALALYNSGMTDNIDYNRATVSLNNARTQKISLENSLNAKHTYLKQLMGYPVGKDLRIRNSFRDMQREIVFDTLQSLQYRNRIEYRLLETNIRLQKSMTDYKRLDFLPSLSGFANYNYIFQNDNFSSLFSKTFPNSTVGISLSFPIFEGGKRIHDLQKSKLSFQSLALDTITLRDEMFTGYTNALASYKSNLAGFNLTKKNISISNDVYNTILKQYREGVKPYFEVIMAETDLRTAELNNLSSLILLMYSKIDLEQALGQISVGY
jgi:outer membrane protein